MKKTMKTRQLVLKARICGLTTKERQTLKRRTLAKKILKNSALFTLWGSVVGLGLFTLASVFAVLLSFWIF
jgi:hypothetical protein